MSTQGARSARDIDHAPAASGKGRRNRFRVIAAGLAGAMIAAMVGVLVATAAPAVAGTPPTWSLAHADIYDSSYNQSSTSVITVTDSNGGITIPTISNTTPGSGFTCGATDDQHRHYRVMHHRGRHR